MWHPLWHLALNAQTPPTAKCDFHGARKDADIRQISGLDDAPYYYACGVRQVSQCVTGKLPPGLVVSVDRYENGWACVTGGDMTSGWVPETRLAVLPDNPKPPLSLWLGTWRETPLRPAGDSNILVLKPGTAPGSISVHGEAAWYGAIVNGGQVVHTGGVDGEATPTGNHLHIVESSTMPFGCVLDLTLNSERNPPSILANDNEECGGVNVRFAGTWERSQPQR